MAKNRITSKGKKPYSMFLDVEKTEYVKERLHSAGLSLSAMMRVSIDQLYTVYKAMEKDGSIDLGVAECFRIMSESMKRISEETKEKNDRIE